MKTDVHAVDILGCAVQCNAGEGMHDQSITQMCIFLDKQFWHSLLDCWMQGQGSMSWYILVHAGADVDLLVLELAGADVDTLVLNVDEA